MKSWVTHANTKDLILKKDIKGKQVPVYTKTETSKTLMPFYYGLHLNIGMSVC